MILAHLPPDRNDGGEEGERRKRQALAHLRRRRARLIRAARRALLLHLLDHGTGTIDAVRDRVPLPAGFNPKAFGGVPGTLARDGVIRSVGFARTGRADAHARPVIVWEMADPGKASAWLATHPELPPAAEGGAE